MINPTKILNEEINFNNNSEVFKYVTLFYNYYANKPCNIHMQNKLVAGIKDKRFKPTTAFNIFREALEQFALYADQPEKMHFAYFYKIFSNMKDKKLQDHYAQIKLKTAALAGNERRKENIRQANERKQTIANLYKLLGTIKNKITSTEFALISGLIKTDKFEKAQNKINNIINKQEVER